MDLKEVGCDARNWMAFSRTGPWQAYVRAVMNFWVPTAPKNQDRLKWLLPDGRVEDLVVSKALSLNLNFSFLNWISLLLMSSSYPIVPVPDPILPSKILRYSRESNPEPLGWQSDILTTIPNMY